MDWINVSMDQDLNYERDTGMCKPSQKPNNLKKNFLKKIKNVSMERNVLTFDLSQWKVGIVKP